MITIRINTDNSAFKDNGAGNEVADMLRRLATVLDHDTTLESVDGMRLRDSNGNTVGEITRI